MSPWYHLVTTPYHPGKNGYVVMGGTSVPVYQKLIDKTKDLHLKANSCCQKIDKKLTLGIWDLTLWVATVCFEQHSSRVLCFVLSSLSDWNVRVCCCFEIFDGTLVLSSSCFTEQQSWNNWDSNFQNFLYVIHNFEYLTQFDNYWWVPTPLMRNIKLNVLHSLYFYRQIGKVN